MKIRIHPILRAEVDRQSFTLVGTFFWGRVTITDIVSVVNFV